MQEYFFDEVVVRGQANFRLEKELVMGSTIDRVYGNNGVPQSVTDKYAAVNFGDIKNTKEQLTVDSIETVPFKISELDEIQMYVGKREHYTKKFMEVLRLSLNGRYLAEVTNAAQTMDAADFGGTAGLGADVTPANVLKLFSRVFMKLARGKTMKKGDMFGNLIPELFQALQEATGYRESAFGDAVAKDGAINNYLGFDLWVHNAGYWTGTLRLVTQPTDGDTVTIKVGTTNITFTFKTVLGTTPGNVLIGADNDAAGTNLVALLNAPTTTTAQGVGFTAGGDEHFALYGITATYTGATDLVTMTWRGAGSPITGSTFTSANNGWNIAGQSTGKNIAHCMFGVKGAVDFVVQEDVQLDIDKDPDAIKVFKIKQFIYYGKKTFADGAKKLVNVKVNTTLFT